MKISIALIAAAACLAACTDPNPNPPTTNGTRPAESTDGPCGDGTFPKPPEQCK